MPPNAFSRFLAWFVEISGRLVLNMRTKLKPRPNEVHQAEITISRNEVNPQVAEQLHSDSISSSTTTQADEGRLAYSIPLSALHNTTVDLTLHLTENHYRFVDADAFIHNRTLVIHETSSLPDLYTTISYVWFGLVAEPSQLEQQGSFRVFCGFRSDGTPREDGGPISLKVLEHACRWASNSSSSYLWVDRLCIIQTSKQDKSWQISRMYDIYAGSEQCIVLPGGLQRLASVFDETSWADRAWTYQEAIVTWDYAIVLTKDWYRPKGEQHWLVEGECHWQYLQQLFIEGDNLLTRRVGTEEVGANPCLIFGRNGKALNVLRRIMEYKAYNHIVEEGETISQQTIRQLVLQGVAMRVSSRPVDMVFSVLGSIGVEDAFRHRIGEFRENERFCATLTLVEAMLSLEDDESDDPSVSMNATSSTLLDLPLWQSLELFPSTQSSCSGTKASIGLDPARLPSLLDLAQLLDNDSTEHQLSHHPDILLKRGPLPEWKFDVEHTEDDPSARAAVIALELPDDDLLRGYSSDLGQDRVVVEHETEGFIELCRRLELKQDGDTLDRVVFGWSLKLDGHPYIRFYKFDITHLIL